MKPLNLLAIVDKKKPVIEFKNLVPLKDKNSIILDKTEKIIKVIVVENKRG